MTDSDDYYERLGVDQKATQEQIKKAFKKQALKYHPDRSDEPDAEENFKLIAEAYEVLKDPQQRQRYDRFGKQGVQGTASRSANYTDIEDLLNGFGFGDIFGDIFGGRQQRSSRGADLKLQLALELEEAVFGCNKQVTLNKRQQCAECNGQGTTDPSSKQTCPQCHGRGKVSSSRGFFTLTEPCSKCRGRGELITDPCTECSGSGEVRREKTLEIDVPAGVDTGHRIRIEGEGEPGSTGPGNLYVEIAVKPHKRFKRRGADLYTQVPISFIQAALGGTIEVPLLEDAEPGELIIKPGTQTGESFVMRKLGAHHLRRRGRGDLYVQVKVVTPTDLTEEEEKLFEQLAEIRGEQIKPDERSVFEKIRDVFTG